LSILTAHSPADLLQRFNKRTYIAFSVFAVAAIIGTTGLVSASADGNDKPTKDYCIAHGYKNYGQCVADWVHGSGYGGHGHHGHHGHHRHHGHHHHWWFW